MIDLRYWTKPNGELALQFRVGTPERTGNPKHDAWSDKSEHGKYRTTLKWGKWKYVRTERSLTVGNIPKLEAE